jgi:Kef-type K+ transport system membrane component KefB
MLVGAGLDLKMFANSLSTQLPFVLAILAALIVGKLVAALVTQLTARYTWNEGLGMWSLSLPQLAATLAAALTAFQTQNAAGERLIDETVMSAVIVLMVVTATLGPILTQRWNIC